jgi:hypothetical protein
VLYYFGQNIHLDKTYKGNNMEKTLIIGNVVALLASLFMAYSGILKKKTQILIAQNIQIILLIISNIILGGISGAISNTAGLIRNLLYQKKWLKMPVKILLTVISSAIAIKLNTEGLVGYLPLLANAVYIFLMDLKDIKKFKLLLIATMTMWLIYDILIKSYTSAVFDFATIMANITVLIKMKNNINTNITK